MKTTKNIFLSGLLIILFCSCEEGYSELSSEFSTAGLISNDFSKAESEINKTMTAIMLSIQEKDADKLISFHAYGPKFTEFKDGKPRTGSAENEEYERGLVAAISGFDYDLNDLKIDVFGNDVGKVTFHADFRPTIDGQTHQILSQATLIFVRVGKDWKIVHEHLSPLVE